jgi:adenine-specific DNA methylase
MNQPDDRILPIDQNSQEQRMILPSEIYQRTPLNKSEIPQSDLNIENKTRSNPLAWNGQFSPQLIQVLLSTYAESGLSIFDPFLGSGTVLLEADRAGLAACGTEINPAAILYYHELTSLSTFPLTRTSRNQKGSTCVESSD